MSPTQQTHLKLFDASKGLDRGATRFQEILWYLVKWFFFLSPAPWPSKLRVFLLRCFGAKVGKRVVIKPRVNIHLPWKLKLGNDVWIGEETFLLNLEPIEIADDCCVSQRAFLCTGNHDFRSEDFSYRNAPITLNRGAWVGAQVFVGPGVTIGTETVIVAGSVVTSDLPDNKICYGNPATPSGNRWDS